MMEVDMKWRSTMKNKNLWILCTGSNYLHLTCWYWNRTKLWFLTLTWSPVTPSLLAFYWSIRGHLLRKQWIYIRDSCKHQVVTLVKTSTLPKNWDPVTGWLTKTSDSRYLWRRSLSWIPLKNWRWTLDNN